MLIAERTCRSQNSWSIFDRPQKICCSLWLVIYFPFIARNKRVTQTTNPRLRMIYGPCLSIFYIKGSHGIEKFSSELKRWVNQAVRLQASSFSMAKAEAPNPSRWLWRWVDVIRFTSLFQGQNLVYLDHLGDPPNSGWLGSQWELDGLRLPGYSFLTRGKRSKVS